MNRWLLAAAAVLALAAGAAAQNGGTYTGVATTTVNRQLVVLPGAQITVCAYNASGVPCTPEVTVYTDSTLGTVLPQPITADSYGNFSFSVAPGAYQYCVTASGTTTQCYQISVPWTGGSASITNLTAAQPAITPTSIEGVEYADQFSGADAGAQINAAETQAALDGYSVFIPVSMNGGTAAEQVVFKVPTFGPGRSVVTIKEANTTNLAAPFTVTASGVTLSGFTLDCNEANNTGSSQIDGCLYANGVSNLTVRDMTVQNWYGAAGSSAPCVAIGGAGANITVQDSLIQNCGASGRAGDGVYASGTQIKIQRNTIKSASDTGAVCEAFTDCLVEDNLFVSDTQSVALSGLVTATASSNGIVAGNVIDGCGPASNGGCIEALNESPGSLTNVTISHNVIHNVNDTRGIFIERVTGFTASGNILDDITGTALQAVLVQESHQGTVSGGGVSNSVDGYVLAGCTDCSINGVSVGDSTTADGLAAQSSPVAISISSLTHASGICTATYGSDSIVLAAGDTVTVSGATGDTACNGTFSVATVPASTQFTYAVAGSGSPGGSPTFVMELTRGGLKGNFVHGATDGIAISGVPQSFEITGNDLVGNTSYLIDSTTGGSYTASNNSSAVNYLHTSALNDFTGSPPFYIANNASIVWLNPTGTPCSIFTVTSDSNPITRAQDCNDTGGFQWTDSAASTTWLALSASGLTLDEGATLVAGKTLSNDGTISGGTVNCTTCEQGGSQLALASQLPLSGTVSITANATALNAVTGTATITGATTSMACVASAAGTSDADAFPAHCYVSAANTVTVQVVTRVTDSSAPAITYNIRVIQ